MNSHISGVEPDHMSPQLKDRIDEDQHLKPSVDKKKKKRKKKQESGPDVEVILHGEEEEVIEEIKGDAKETDNDSHGFDIMI